MTKLIRPQKISDQILALLEERIASGEYPEGSRIPPERTLAGEFGVSRPSVRAALAVLVSRKILEARQGDGYYVSSRSQQDFLQSWQELLGKHSHWERDVYDFSRHMEGIMAALAAERRTEADLSRIRFWLDNFEAACAQNNLEHQTEADASFHQAIADATHNILFGHLSGSLLRMLYRETRSNIIKTNRADNPRPTLIRHHRALFEAIRDGNGPLAAETAQNHLDFVSDHIRADRAYQSRSEHAGQLAQNDLDKVKNW
ncbi:FadR/GntR family transcriptional regulator [Bergeriella denitrificans]|uniref:Pyruvate dehydrogenase complex repressor n=1 Tax=Bergeriella denitrificans TaxID=494 RepID=A0A378UDM4_BERDE|nr:FadR/GntR family transcriptional regulator [Bergeriella denitrificans]STZ75504.1 GntR family transcriptional regulator [Bergeriella denitrificans]